MSNNPMEKYGSSGSASESDSQSSHAHAASLYDTHAHTHTPNQRELEARVLLKSAKALQVLCDHWDSVQGEDLDDALRYNRQIWMMFVDTAMEDNDPARPLDLRNNIANLGHFIFKRTNEILIDPAPQKIEILIEINREVAAGLMNMPPSFEADQSAHTPNNSTHNHDMTSSQSSESSENRDSPPQGYSGIISSA